MEELNELHNRFSEIEGELPNLISSNYEKYILLLREYNLLKEFSIEIQTINTVNSEIEMLREMHHASVNDEDKSFIEGEIINKEAIIELSKGRIEEIKTRYKKTPDTDVPENSDGPVTNNIESKSKRGKKDFNTAIKKIKGKVWDVIKEKIIETLSTPFDPGNPISEDELITALPEFETIVNEIVYLETVTPESQTLNILFERDLSVISREFTLKYALYNFHKASHIIGAGEIHGNDGIKSWSLSSCYQGALLAAKSIINLLGVSINNFNGNDYLVDVWNSTNSNNNRQLAGIIRFSYRLEHRHIWQLFKRLLNSCTVSVWNERYVEALSKIELENFPKQRNVLNYWYHRWIFDDLHHFDIDNKFGLHTEGLEYGIKTFNLKSDFSLSLAQIVLRMSYELIKDISDQTNLLKQEFDLIENFLKNEDRHPIYLRNFSD